MSYNKSFIKTAFLTSALFYMGQGTLIAAPVSPEQAMKEATEFRKANSRVMRMPAADTQRQPSLVYTARTDKFNCFYIFNDHESEGFTIVSADDRLPGIIGFSDSGEFDINRISPDMKWWLSQYEQQIASFLDEDPQISADNTRRRAITADKAEIKPLLTSTWNQTEPYNNDCPIDPRTGARSVTGCVATAMAQVMRHHQWPINPKGTSGSYIFNGSTLDWANMIDTYENGNYTPAQSNAVALLMRQCGASVNMMYSSYESGAYSQDVQVALVDNFDYDKSIKMLFREYFTQREWNSLVYTELENNRPVYYSGRSSEGGHAFVVDGYLGRNYYHLNWGWGGYQDGYFLLNALNPSAGGTGSYSGGYNLNQSIMTNVMKNKGTTQRQVSLLSTGTFRYAGSDTYKIEDGADNLNLIYNPLMYSVSVTLGLKVVSETDETKVTYVKAPSTTRFESLHGITEYQLAIPSLPDGEYRVYPVMLTEYDTWEDIMVPVNRQRFVSLNVRDGKQTFSNNGPEKEEMPKLIASVPEHLSPLYNNAPMAFKITVMNVGKGDYDDNLYLSLYKNKDPYAFIYRYETRTSVPAGSSVDIEFSSPDTSVAGNYTMYFSDEEGEDLFEPIQVTLTTGNFQKPSDPDINFINISPQFMDVPQETGVMILAENKSDAEKTVDFSIQLLKASDLSVVKTLKPGNPVVFQGKRRVNLAFSPMMFDIEPGYYFWLAVDNSGKTLSAPQPIVVTGIISQENGIYYQATSSNPPRARIIPSQTGNYEGIINIPNRINGYIVTEIKADAFSFSSEMTEIRLPSDLTRIYPGSFYMSGLTRIDIEAPNPPYVYNDAFDHDRINSIVLSSEYGNNNIYHSTPGWSGFRMSSWTITADSDIKLSGLKNDPATGNIYTPYYVSSFLPMSFGAEPPAGKVVKAVWTIDGKEETKNFWRRVTLPMLTGQSASVHLSSTTDVGVDQIDDNNDKRLDIYSSQGILILRNADNEMIKSLPAGIYIANGKKFIVR